MNKTNIPDCAEEEIEGTLLMLTNLVKASELGKLNQKKLYKLIKQLGIQPQINLSVTINKYPDKVGWMVTDNHGSINGMEEAV